MATNKILIVDDSSNLRKVLKDLLVSAGYQVVEAANGEVVHDMIAMQLDISIILLDIEMPGLDGYETMRTIRDICRNCGIKVCFVTAMDEKEAVMKAVALGASGYITKPIKSEVLLSKVKHLLESPYVDYSAKIETDLSAHITDEFKIDTDVRIKQLSSSGIVFESMIPLEEDLCLLVESPDLAKLFGLKKPLDCKIISCEKKKSLYICESFFVDASESLVKKIKNLIFSNKDKAPLQ
jgi:CheY-like chemotaxis protein